MLFQPEFELDQILLGKLTKLVVLQRIPKVSQVLGEEFMLGSNLDCIVHHVGIGLLHPCFQSGIEIIQNLQV